MNPSIKKREEKEGDGREEEKRGNRTIEKGTEDRKRWERKIGKGKRKGERKNKKENVEDVTNSTDF